MENTISTPTIKQVAMLAKKAGYNGIVDAENVATICKSLAENHQNLFVEYIDKLLNMSVRQWEFYSSSHGEMSESFLDNYQNFTTQAEEMFSFIDVTLDWPGLYPTYFVKYDGKIYNEYSAENAMRRHNGFWK